MFNFHPHNLIRTVLIFNKFAAKVNNYNWIATINYTKLVIIFITLHQSKNNTNIFNTSVDHILSKAQFIILKINHISLLLAIFRPCCIHVLHGKAGSLTLTYMSILQCATHFARKTDRINEREGDQNTRWCVQCCICGNGNVLHLGL